MKIGYVIQARMGSERLPGKVLLPLYAAEDSTILDQIVNSLLLIAESDQIVLATSHLSKNDKLLQFAQRRGIKCFRGSEDNVLDRFCQVADKFGFDHIVRLTGDNPFIDSKHIETVVGHHLVKLAHYTYSTGLPVGMNIEVVANTALQETYKVATSAAATEHVTYFIRQNPHRYVIETYAFEVPETITQLRLTVDTPQDFILAKNIFMLLRLKGASVSFDFLLSVYEQRPELFQINNLVVQREPASVKQLPVVVFRANGDTAMGLGHLYRCASLADMLNSKYECILAYKSSLEGITELFANFFSQFIHLTEEKSSRQVKELINQSVKLSSVEPVTYLLDGYAFDTSYQQALRSENNLLVCIDDIHAYPFVCDLLINHASSARAEDYQLADHTELLFGLKYALVGAPFRRAAQQRSGSIGDLHKVFVCLGGADPLNLTLKVAADCLQSKGLEVHAVLGPAHPSRKSFDSLQQANGDRLTIYNSLSPEEMASLMQQCALAVTSPSGVALEYLSTGGHLFMLPFADNQQEFYEDAIAKQLALPYDAFPTGRVDQELIQDIFDGRQAERFQAAFHNLLNQNTKHNG